MGAPRPCAHHGKPEAKVLVLIGGVQTYVTMGMLEFFAIDNLVLGLGSPNCSHVQNEDLLSFFILRVAAHSAPMALTAVPGSWAFTNFHWAEMWKTKPRRHVNKVAAAAAAEEQEGHMEGEQEAAGKDGEGGGAPALVGAKQPRSRADGTRYQTHGESRRLNFFFPLKKTDEIRATAQLAIFELYSKMLGFKPLDSTLPSAFLKERKQQRGDVDKRTMAAEPKPKTDVFSRLASAGQLAPKG